MKNNPLFKVYNTIFLLIWDYKKIPGLPEQDKLYDHITTASEKEARKLFTEMKKEPCNVELYAWYSNGAFQKIA